MVFSRKERHLYNNSKVFRLRLEGMRRQNRAVLPINNSSDMVKSSLESENITWLKVWMAQSWPVTSSPDVAGVAMRCFFQYSLYELPWNTFW